MTAANSHDHGVDHSHDTHWEEGLIHSSCGRACGDEKIFERKNLPHFS